MIPELTKEFLIESHEGLDGMDRDLVELEKRPRDGETLGRVFRAIHTIKGTCGFLGFHKLEAVSHAGENLLSRMRDGELLLDAAITTGLLKMVDAIREILAAVEATESEGDGDYSGVLALLGTLNARTSNAAVVAAPIAAVPHVGPPAADVPVATVQPQSEGSAASTATADHDDSDLGPEPQEGAIDTRSGVSDSSLRVDVGLIDKLMNLVGELVLARNQILQFTSTQTDSAFVGATQRLNLVTSELQEGVMKTRMQPIGNIWSKYPRVVRDLSVQCGKRVRIQMDGRTTELDKTIIEAIKDPLVHVIRNAVDHGIEPPVARIAAGKPEEGVIRLRAFHEGGQINIEIGDDGAGIDVERVRAKAVQRGLVSAEQAGRLSDHDVAKLIFAPGFSTAEKITNVSGRGVGMDVVKTNIEKIGGTVDIHNRPGAGTTLRIKIPLTLAIIPALMVTSGGERFAIPQVSLLELVRLEGDQARLRIERIQDAQFYRLRGNLLPIAHINEELRLEGAGTEDIVNIVVLQSDGRQFGLVVDAINDTEEIVVKPLGKQCRGVTAFAGATIMGDGRIALILDVLGLAQGANILSGLRDRLQAADDAAAVTSQASDMQTLLLFRVGGNRLAIPLAAVARLEEFRTERIERAGGRDAIQYRGDILPLLSLAEYFGEPVDSGAELRQVVVYSENGRSVGLVVDQILDIVNRQVTVQRNARRRGLVGSAVIGERVTDLLDLHAVIDEMDPQFHEEQAHVA